MASANHKSTAFVLVPGGMSPGYFYHKVTALLTSAGYTAIPIDLPSVGDQGASSPATISDDAAHVRNQVSKLLAQGKGVVLVGNGYGGLVITEAAKDLERGGPGKLLHLVYLASLLGPVGSSAFELVSEQLSVDITSPGPDVAYLPPPPPADAGAQLFSDLSEDEQLHYAKMLRPHSAAAMMGRLTYAAYEDYPTTVVVSNRDKAVSAEFQLRKLNELATQGVVKMGLRQVVMEGDHIIMLSRSDEVVKVLMEAASGVL